MHCGDLAKRPPPRVAYLAASVLRWRLTILSDGSEDDSERGDALRVAEWSEAGRLLWFFGRLLEDEAGVWKVEVKAADDGDGPVVLEISPELLMSVKPV